MQTTNLQSLAALVALGVLGGACVESPTEPVRRNDGGGAAEASDAAAQTGRTDSGLDARAQGSGEGGAQANEDASGPEAPEAGESEEDAAPPVECTSPADCAGQAKASRCGAEGMCKPCQQDSECTTVIGSPRCIGGEGCVGCLADTDCPTEAQHCDPAQHRCVACLASDQCEEATASRCSANQRCEKCASAADCGHIGDGYVCNDEGTCVECASNNDCKDPTRSQCSAGGQCEPCAESAACSHLAGTGVCSAGTCVECTRDERAACAETDSGRAVCDAKTKTCTEFAPGQTTVCGACVSDVQCGDGQRCVETTWNSGAAADEPVGTYCMWQRGAAGAPVACGPSAAPFAIERSLGSADEPDVEQPTCLLAVSTCDAYSQFRESCGRYGANPGVVVSDFGDSQIPEDERGTAQTAQAIVPDDSVCGQGGLCVASTPATGSYFCTIECLSAADCDRGSICRPGPPKVCNVQ